MSNDESQFDINIEDLFDSDDPNLSDESVDSDQEVVFSDLTSDQLCDFIVVFRYLGLFRDRAVKAMKELAERRVAGNTFSFEKEIEEKLNSLPKLTLDQPLLFTPKSFSFIGKK